MIDEILSKRTNVTFFREDNSEKLNPDIKRKVDKKYEMRCLPTYNIFKCKIIN